MSDNFIMEFDNFISEEHCKKLIEIFCRYEASGLTVNRQDHKPNGAGSVIMDDKQLFSESLITDIEVDLHNGLWCAGIDEIFFESVYPQYAQKYGILNNLAAHGNRWFKIQKTRPGEGYHTWHTENMTKYDSSRILVWILYLNTIEDGGETEWLYLSKRSKPQQGKLAIWPAGFTHTHRGNPPLSESKYIMTGWVEYH